MFQYGPFENFTLPIIDNEANKNYYRRCINSNVVKHTRTLTSDITHIYIHFKKE